MKAIAKRWRAAEPDPDMQAELDELLEGPSEVLAQRFSGRLQFGTAGLRAAIGAGPLRMNRLVVRQAAAGLVRYLLDTDPDASERGLIIGYDARRKSDAFAFDTARVAAAMNMKVRLFDRRVPTPVLAWAITEVGAAAGVVVTASHNPPTDNGYKVYLGDGSQIVAPQDVEISQRINLFDPTEVPLAPLDDPHIETVGDELVDGYVAFAAAVRLRPNVAAAPIAYTAMHGVGGAVVQAAFRASGLPAPVVVDDQHQPDGTFPTVSFPNPEEPGAMERVIEAATSAGLSIALANDPDADRLGVAIADDGGRWRRLAGDEIGWLLADYVLNNTEGDDRLVVTTLVSSSLLAKMAEHHGVTAVETFTGFKWIAHEIRKRPALRFVFGYEQALGYLVARRPRDKDGITAAVVCAEMVADLAARGSSVQQRLDEIAERFGHHRISEVSVPMPAVEGARRVAELRSDPPGTINDRDVVAVKEYPTADLLRLQLDGDVRIQVRPSGTEPKVKVYGEAVDADPAPFVEAIARLIGSGSVDDPSQDERG